MSVELIKRPINVYRTVDEQQKEELMETGMIVPDSKPDVLDVLVVDTDVIVRTREKTGRVMEIGGEICYQVLYRADNQEQSLESLNVKSPWSISCNYPGGEDEAYALVKSSVEHTNIDIVNGRKLSAKSVVKLNVKFVKVKKVEAGETIQGEQIYQKADPQEIAMLEDIGEKIINVAENVEIGDNKPVIDEIIYSNATLKDVSIQENMMMDCMLEVDCLYRADNNDAGIENVHFDVPITKNLEVENYNYSDISANAYVKSLSLKPDEDIDGLLTRVKIEAEVAVEYSLFSKDNVYLVKDAYAMGYAFELEKKPVTLVVEETEIREDIQVNGNMALDGEGEAIEEVLSLTTKPRILSVENDNANIAVHGCLDICVLYCTGADMRVIRGSNQELPFTHNIPLQDPNADYENNINLSINENSYEIVSDTSVDIKAQLEVKAHLSKKQEMDLVVGIKDIKTCEKKENPPLLFYYPQKGDTLWDIAKRYKVPIQKILNDNEMIEETEPLEGKKILLVE
jgi:LysM repeat protein